MMTLEKAAAAREPSERQRGRSAARFNFTQHRVRRQRSLFGASLDPNSNTQQKEQDLCRLEWTLVRYSFRGLNPLLSSLGAIHHAAMFVGDRLDRGPKVFVFQDLAGRGDS